MPRFSASRVVSRPGNGGVNLGLGDGFLGVYKLTNPGTVNHICIGVDDYDPERIAVRLKDFEVPALSSAESLFHLRFSGGFEYANARADPVGY